jgi:hypothetical protein
MSVGFMSSDCFSTSIIIGTYGNCRCVHESVVPEQVLDILSGRRMVGCRLWRIRNAVAGGIRLLMTGKVERGWRLEMEVR